MHAMDPDSFLELLSPHHSPFDAWSSPPHSSPFASHNSSHHDFSHLAPLLDLKPVSSYSSVLKLSTVASALHGFSTTPSHVEPPRSMPTLGTRPGGCPFIPAVRTSVNLEEEDDEVKVIPVPARPLPVSPCSHKPCGSIKRAKLQCSSEEDAVLRETNLKNVSKAGLTQREAHIYSERQRRKNMRDSFSALQALVPNLKLKHTDRITVLTEVITYIRSLRGTLEDLERKRSDIMALLGLSEDNGSSSGVLLGNSSTVADQDKANLMVEVSARLSGSDVFITLNIPKRRGVWSAVLMFLQKNNVDVLNATMATCDGSNFHCIHGKATNTTRLERMDLQDELKDLIMKELLQQRRLRF